jgi:hypothetical protein
MAQDVKKRHPSAVHRIAGLGGPLFVDLKAATDDAARRDRGGRIRGFAFGGMPYEGGASYVPGATLQIGHTMPGAPGASGQGQNQIDPFKLASSSLDLGKKIKGLGGGGLFGSGDPGLDEVTQAGAEAGLSPEELGFGGGGEDLIGAGIFRRGGRIAGFGDIGHFADGGGDDSFDDRFNASTDYASRDAIPVSPSPGIAPDTMASFADRWGDIPQGSNFSPDNYNKLLDYGTFSPDMPSSRAAEHLPDIPLPRERPAFAPELSAPVEVADRRIAGLGSPFMGDTSATSGPMSFAPAPELDTRGGDESGKQAGFGGLLGFLNNPLNLSPDLRRAGLAAAFGMMASRSPFLGNAIGEGGLAGLSAYSGAKKEAFNEEEARKKLEQHADETSKRLQLETRKQQSLEEYRSI